MDIIWDLLGSNQLKYCFRYKETTYIYIYIRLGWGNGWIDEWIFLGKTLGKG